MSFISAGGDQQCSAVGMGVLKEDDIAISLGTGGYIIQATDTVSNSKSYITNVYSIDSLYMKESILPTSSSALNWGQDNLYPNLSNEEFYSEIENILMWEAIRNHISLGACETEYGDSLSCDYPSRFEIRCEN